MALKSFGIKGPGRKGANRMNDSVNDSDVEMS
jgi:hypothetical protein